MFNYQRIPGVAPSYLGKMVATYTINIFSFFVRSRRNLQRSWLTDFFRSCRRHGPSKAGTQQHFRAFSLSLSFSLLSVRAMFIPELVQRRAKSLNQVVLLAAPNAMA